MKIEIEWNLTPKMIEDMNQWAGEDWKQELIEEGLDQVQEQTREGADTGEVSIYEIHDTCDENIGDFIAEIDGTWEITD